MVEERICEDCGFEISEYDYEGCSEFCSRVPKEERKKWKEFKDGDWGLYPCSGCGVPVDDEFSEKEEDRVCLSCYDKARHKTRTNLLKECLYFKNFLGEALTKAIKEELGK
jgi:hypothetical protein